MGIQYLNLRCRLPDDGCRFITCSTHIGMYSATAPAGFFHLIHSQKAASYLFFISDCPNTLMGGGGCVHLQVYYVAPPMHLERKKDPGIVIKTASMPEDAIL